MLSTLCIMGKLERSINWTQFKDPLCYPCLAGTVVAPWALTQEVSGFKQSF